MATELPIHIPVLMDETHMTMVYRHDGEVWMNLVYIYEDSAGWWCCIWPHGAKVPRQAFDVPVTAFRARMWLRGEVPQDLNTRWPG